MRILLTMFLFSMHLFAFSQISEDTNTPVRKEHSPRIATVLSTFVPGAGQVYNKKYWKIPVIYGGFATFAYYSGVNNKLYLKYRKLYEQKLDETIDVLYENINAETLRKERENWRRNRDLNYIGMGFLYILQIIDANVDAHLFYYDISDDLTLRYEPSFQQFSDIRSGGQISALGLRFSISF